MHISDGVLSPFVIGTGWAIALPTLALSVRRLRPDRVGAYGVVAAAFFAGSTIHVPVGPFSMHLVLSGIAGLLLGWGALTVITVGLLLQALLIGFGGLTVLGINIAIMALPGAIMGSFGRRWLKRTSAKRRPWIGAVTGGGTILISVRFFCCLPCRKRMDFMCHQRKDNYMLLLATVLQPPARWLLLWMRMAL